MLVPTGVLRQQGAPVAPYFSHSWATSGTLSGTWSQRLGWRFSLSANITINYLSYWQTSNQPDERIIIHRVSDGATIASVDITGTNDTWVDVGISEVTLVSTETYTCSGRPVSSARYMDRNPTGLSFDSRITKTANVTGTDDTLPTGSTGNVYVTCGFGYA